ncbi:glutamine synthetase [Streptomyces griseus]|nr:glutamine synthetase [Streptomyces griseus]RAN19974.1 glutamine synthetase [Streptomyces badius]RAN27896.1 glutamine synthetase [Streptomyces badius]
MAVSCAAAKPGRPVSNFLRNKKQEWEEYRSEVTAFELKNLLPVL